MADDKEVELVINDPEEEAERERLVAEMVERENATAPKEGAEEVDEA